MAVSAAVAIVVAATAVATVAPATNSVAGQSGDSFTSKASEQQLARRLLFLIISCEKENSMEKRVFTEGERTDQLCTVCGEERGHIVTAVNKRGQISRVTCSRCATLSRFKSSLRTSPRLAVKTPSPYDRTSIYHAGESFTHERFGIGEVTQLVEPKKIDVLFQDRVRRLIHAQG